MLIMHTQISHGANNWDIGLRCACRNGNLQIVNLLISHGEINDWDHGLWGACEGENMEIVKLTIKIGGKPESCHLLNNEYWLFG